ncbi:23S rRNA methyltransferase, partial [Mobiluncus mulieris]|nr:23S rRNA methyltransferase [Mobiluncus mulieris]
LVVNPPRRGLGNELSKWIEKSEIPHVIYSSCYQPSLVDNLHRMKSYRVTELKLVDMFPHTRHVETIVLLSRK